MTKIKVNNESGQIIISESMTVDQMLIGHGFDPQTTDYTVVKE